MTEAYLLTMLRFDPRSVGRLIGRDIEECPNLDDAMRAMHAYGALAKGHWHVAVLRVTLTEVTEVDHLCSNEKTHSDLLPAIDYQAVIAPWVESARQSLAPPPPDVIPPQPEVDDDFAFAMTFARVKDQVEAEASQAIQTWCERGESQGFPVSEAVAKIQLYERLPNIELAPADPLVIRSHAVMDFPRATAVTLGERIIVAVLDTGYSPHPAMQGAAVSDVIDCTGLPGAGGDANGHGTFCISQIAGQMPSAEPIGTARRARLVPIRVLHHRDGWGADSWIARGVRAAVSVGARVISMSLGGDSAMPLTHDAIREAVAAGVTVVAAAGNGGPSRGDVGYPARYPECIAVGAVDDDLNPAQFSQRGSRLDVWACGVAQVGATATGQYGRWSGTSMAAPHVAAAIAMYYSRSLSLLGKLPAGTDARGILWATDSAIRGVPAGDIESRGLVQAGGVVLSVRQPADPPAPPPADPPAGHVVAPIALIEGVIEALGLVIGALDVLLPAPSNSCPLCQS